MNRVCECCDCCLIITLATGRDVNKMDEKLLERALKLKLCLRCLCLIINPKYEVILRENNQTIIDYLLKNFSSSSSSSSSTSSSSLKDELEKTLNISTCSCCLGFFQSLSLFKIRNHIRNYLLNRTKEHQEQNQEEEGEKEQQQQNQEEEEGKVTYSLSIIIPPILETLRITIRTLIFNSIQKLAPSPSFEELYLRYIKYSLQDQISFVTDEESDVKVQILSSFFFFFLFYISFIN